jgi:hypothetical protein
MTIKWKEKYIAEEKLKIIEEMKVGNQEQEYSVSMEF